MTRIGLVERWIKYFFKVSSPKLYKKIGGITFPNPLGLAAGFDKNAEGVKLWEALGFGFVEIGTVTPKPQKGNPKKRLFRLKKSQAIINRMGFNNDGVKKIIERLKKYENKKIVIGANIGKNKDTPNEKAVRDYCYCFEKLFPFVDYFTINVSSPNTEKLRQLQEIPFLDNIITQIQEIHEKFPQKKPIFLKIAPDISEPHLKKIIDLIRKKKVGIIATNTSIQKKILQKEMNLEKIEKGGISGEPLKNISNHILQLISNYNKDHAIEVIGVGGVMNKKDAIEKIKLGADAIQIYTGLIYRGPKLIKEILLEMSHL